MREAYPAVHPPHPVAARPVRATRRPVHDASAAVERTAMVFTTLAVLAIFTISPELLALLKVHYITSGGHFFEKIHPATYLCVVAFLLSLLRRGDPAGELNRMVADSKLLLVFFFACAMLMFQCVALKRPFTGVIDTFVLPAVLALTLWNLSPGRRGPPTVALHAAIWINIALAFYEYISGHRLIPITLGKLHVVGDWRSTALLGHPLSAANVIAMYIMGLALPVQGRNRSLWLFPAIAVASSSLMVFGGRMGLVAVVTVLGCLGLVQIVRIICGARVTVPSVIAAVCGLMVVAAVALVVAEAGIFDKMVERFGSDNGSAHARIATLHFIAAFDWRQLLLGTSPGYASAMQSMAGLEYGVENFWIASIVQFGIIQTALITIGLVCFFAELLRRSAPAALVPALFIVIIAAGSVSFSSKTTSLAAYVTLIVLLLPCRRARQVAQTSAARLRHGGRVDPSIQAVRS